MNGLFVVVVVVFFWGGDMNVKICVTNKRDVLHQITYGYSRLTL